MLSKRSDAHPIVQLKSSEPGISVFITGSRGLGFVSAARVVRFVLVELGELGRSGKLV